jgi:copper transport protein
MRRLAAALAVVGALVMSAASPAGAHIGLEESEPANITTVQGPISEVRLTFTGAADPVEDQFAITAQDGTEVPIEAIANDGSDVLVVTTAEPMPAGRTRVAWAIRSGDSHTMTGSLSFTVASIGGATSETPATVTPEPLAGSDAASTDSSPGKGLFDLVGAVARLLVYVALLFCVGGLGYLAWVHRGTVAEGRRLVFYVRRAALVVFVGALIAWVAEIVVFAGGATSALWSPSAWGDLVSSRFAMGTVLRLLGAGLVLAFLKIDLDENHGSDPFEPSPSPSPTGHDARPGGGVATMVAPTASSLTRLRVEASPLAMVGAVLLVASEAFIGHSSTVGPRPVVLASDAGHLVAGGLWAAGTLMLALTLWGRRRRGEPLDARLLGTRFSVMAGWALAVVAVTGLALGWTILGEVGALWSTEFGRLLSLKVFVVAAIAAIGAYNHRVLVPQLGDGDPEHDERFRRTVTLEAGLFAVVLALTALLVVASPV